MFDKPKILRSLQLQAALIPWQLNECFFLQKEGPKSPIYKSELAITQSASGSSRRLSGLFLGGRKGERRRRRRNGGANLDFSVVEEFQIFLNRGSFPGIMEPRARSGQRDSNFELQLSFNHSYRGHSGHSGRVLRRIPLELLE